jgi:Transposase, Mutator family
LELCGGESFEAWKGCLDDLMARGLRAPVLAIIDGNAGLRRAVGLVWPRTAIQRCCVHKLHNLERKAPKHALAEIRDDFHRIVYATNVDTARTAYTAFERTWAKRCPGVVTSLREGGDELLTFFTLPKVQWKTLRTTNTIERLHEEFRRRVKTQGSLPSEGAAMILLFSLVAPSDRWRLAPMRGSGVPDKTERISVAVRGRDAYGILVGFFYPEEIVEARERLAPVPRRLAVLWAGRRPADKNFWNGDKYFVDRARLLGTIAARASSREMAMPTKPTPAAKSAAQGELELPARPELLRPLRPEPQGGGGAGGRA